VNQNTGAIQLAALFPNPSNILRPGQYGKVRAVTRMQSNALLIPQAAVTEQQGSYLVCRCGGRTAESLCARCKSASARGRCGLSKRDLKTGATAWSSKASKNLRPGHGRFQIKPFKSNVE